ncbi:MAG: HD domain-containing phosphohydrolase [Chloroflexota bacterium]
MTTAAFPPRPPAPGAPPAGVVTRITVPAGVFAPGRRPAFTLVDAIGEPTEVDRAWLEDCPGETVGIASSDIPAFRAYLRRYLSDILDTTEVPLADRAWTAHRALVHELAHLFAAGTGGRAAGLMDACRGLAWFLHRHFQPDALFRSLRFDIPHTPVVHGVETAIGAVSVAIADGRLDVPALSTLACAAAVADAGLLDLPRELREGWEHPSPMGWKAIQRHPDLSQRRMQTYGIVAPEALRAVGHHHERWDGAGYPGHLVGAAIPVEARYVAIADTYSALTVPRRGMQRMSRGDALREMARSSGQFDPALLRILVRLLTDGAREPARS